MTSDKKVKKVCAEAKTAMGKREIDA